MACVRFYVHSNPNQGLTIMPSTAINPNQKITVAQYMYNGVHVLLFLVSELRFYTDEACTISCSLTQFRSPKNTIDPTGYNDPTYIHLYTLHIPSTTTPPHPTTFPITSHFSQPYKPIYPKKRHPAGPTQRYPKSARPKSSRFLLPIPLTIVILINIILIITLRHRPYQPPSLITLDTIPLHKPKHFLLRFLVRRFTPCVR